MHRCVLGVFTIKPIGEPGAITFKSLEPRPAMATGEVVLDFIHMETIHCVVSISGNTKRPHETTENEPL